MNKKNKNINVAELFAGVGGFRLGLEKASKSFFKTVYANQWEPSTKKQHAFECYENNFGKTNKSQKHDNSDISSVNLMLEDDINYIKDDINLVVGGFPCQDYSVAATNSKGIEGKKGVLWWEIHKFIKIKNPSYLLLENVDRLLLSPSKQRGRDFLIMLSTLNELGYNVEYRVVNAADYGHVQKRRRVFIFAYKNDSKISSIYKEYKLNKTILTKNIKVKQESNIYKYKIKKSILEISNNESFDFKNYGQMNNGVIETFKVSSVYNGKKTYINDVLLSDGDFKDLILTENQKEKIFSLKDGGKTKRIKNGYEYFYAMGSMRRYDNKENTPARTMLTSESSINRSTHIIKINEDTYRFIHPIEAERFNEFPDNWTSSVESLKKRYFLMGNALVVGLVEKIGKNIKYFLEK